MSTPAVAKIGISDRIVTRRYADRAGQKFSDFTILLKLISKAVDHVDRCEIVIGKFCRDFFGSGFRRIGVIKIVALVVFIPGVLCVVASARSRRCLLLLGGLIVLLRNPVYSRNQIFDVIAEVLIVLDVILGDIRFHHGE